MSRRAGSSLSLAGAAFGGYLYWSLRGARTEISRTAERVERAHAEAARIEERLRESAARMRYTASELAQAIDDLRQLQDATAGRIRAEFSERIKAIDEAVSIHLPDGHDVNSLFLSGGRDAVLTVMGL